MNPLVIELFCGRFGWSRGFVAEGYRAVGFDIVHEPYHGDVPAGCSLALQDVLTLHGSQFKDAACLVASPPCQEYSYMAMPWSLAKAKAAAIRADETGESRRKLTALFDACFRIHREASEAAGRYIPMVVENVKGAQPWVGPAKAHFGSFYLWGDVESVGGRITIGKFGQSLRPMRGKAKVPGLNWSGSDQPGYVARGFNVTAEQRMREAHNTESGHGQNPVNGVQQPGHSGRAWFADPDVAGHFSSKSPARKAASALIAEIPYDLAQWVARALKPENSASPGAGRLGYRKPAEKAGYPPTLEVHPPAILR